MILELPFRFPLAQGLHARPSAMLRARARVHAARLQLANDRSGRTAELGNLLSLLATDTRMGDPCRLLAEGPGAAEAPQKGLYLGGERATTPRPDQEWKVVCLDLATGKTQWEQAIHQGAPPQPAHLKNGFASETPVTDGEKTFMEWSAEFDCAPEREAELINNIGGGVFQGGFDALKRAFGG